MRDERRASIYLVLLLPLCLGNSIFSLCRIYRVQCEEHLDNSRGALLRMDVRVVEDRKMKAYCVFEGDGPWHGCLLVYAKSAQKARYKGFCNNVFGGDYIDFRARRVKEYDEYFNGQEVIFRNENLPDEAPDFYTRDV